MKNGYKVALVLSGGGSKGSYEVGVWKALKKLNIKIDIVTGSSIGSINGALVVQNDYRLAKKLWLNTSTKNIFSADIESGNYKEYLKLLDDFFKNGGMSFDKAEEYIRCFVNEKKIRKSRIDYGLVTVSLTTKKARMLSKEQIPNGKLVDYIVASATCFPAVSKKNIDGEYFIDGGYYDNMPINLAISMGANYVIAVNLDAVGMVKKIDNQDVKVEMITCSDKKKFDLTFTSSKAKHLIKMGYYDTMKHFNKLDGRLYTFKKNDLDKNYNSISPFYISLLKDLLLSAKKNKVITEIFNITKYKKMFNKLNQNLDIKEEVNSSLEYLGDIFNISKDKIYDINHYNRLLIKQVKNLSYIKLDKGLKGKMLISYMYNKYVNSNVKEELVNEIFNLALVFQKEFLATVYLIAVSKKYPITLKSDQFYQEILDYLKPDNKK